MNFTDIFIRRPVLATVISLTIFVMGLRSVGLLPVLQYPHTEAGQINVTTAYFGANAELVAGFITTPLEKSIAQAQGIDYISSTSTQGLSTIRAVLRLNYDSNKALAEVMSKVNAVSNQLPAESQQPVVTIDTGMSFAAMYISFGSEILPVNKVTDYVIRAVVPKLQSVPGVQQVIVQGAKRFAIRAWLDPDKLAAYGMTATEVAQAMGANDYLSAVGRTRGQMVQVDLTASTNLKSLDEFRKLILKSRSSGFVRLEDVANVTLGADDTDSFYDYQGKPNVALAIQIAPAANLIDVNKRLKQIFPSVQAELPEGLYGIIAFDGSRFVSSAINEVIRTLIEALLIVTFVVFAFLGSPRSVLVPTLAIPLSIVGTFTVMLMLGFSINLLTLLALVLSIGLVVDDAIIVVENVSRHLEEGMKPFQAAVLAARELAGPIIAMTLVLVAVYIPIGFMGGLTGTLFTEFAFTLVGTVTISAIVALTLSPMMCANVLKPHAEIEARWEKKVVQFIDKRFDELRERYRRLLDASLAEPPVIVVFSIIILVSIYFLYNSSRTELAPQEDQGLVGAFLLAAPNSTPEQRHIYHHEVFRIESQVPEYHLVFQFDNPGFAMTGLALKPWDERDRTASEIQAQLQGDLSKIPGTNIQVFQPPSLPGGRGLPVEFVLQTTEPFTRLNEVTNEILAEAQKSGRFLFVDTDLKYDKPQAEIVIDREKVAQFGLTMRDVGSALTAMLGGGYINYFEMEGQSYKVIPQVEQRSRLNVSQLEDYYIRTASGASIPLSTIAHIKTSTQPRSLQHFQQLNSATIMGAPMIGTSVGDAIAYLQDLAKEKLPPAYSVDFSGTSRQFIHESSGFVMTFFFALLIIYLTLAAQFESFRDPLIILVSVPMSICGALIFIALGLGGATLNIYTQVGLVTLIGLISKHGILIVEFANGLQEKGMDKRQAIEEAAAIRLRPILMTTAAMVLGVMPLVFAAGAGAASRFNLGLVIVMGLSIGTCFTLFVVPGIYMLVARDHRHMRREPEAKEVAA
jgi:multidrug efflux pump